MSPSPDEWEPIQRVRTYEQVMAQLEQRMLDGRLRPGDHLPSERELSSLLGVSRPSLRESLRVLEALGAVAVRPGGGSEGGAILSDVPGSGFVTLLKLQLALGHFTQQDVLDTRLALETWSCREAALRASDQELLSLAEILDQMDEPAISTDEFNRLDTLFHVQIAESTGSGLTAHMMRSLRTAINRQMIEAYAGLEDWKLTARIVRQEHREILSAITAHDANLSARRVQQHIESFYATGGVASAATASSATASTDAG